MIKNIKRVGIIFLIVAIICLMAMGCLSVNIVTSNSSNVSVLSSEKSDSTISNNISINGGLICENTSREENDNGGGLCVSTDSILKIRGGIFYKNVSQSLSADGAGIALSGSNITADITNVLIAKNINVGGLTGSNSIGAGVSISGDIVANISNARIEYNSATLAGGGIAVWQGVLNLSNSFITNNTAFAGAGIYILNKANCDVKVNSTIITNNISSHGSGVWLSNDSCLTIGDGTQIFDNTNIDEEMDNIEIVRGKIIIDETLINTKIGIHQTTISAYTIGYSAHNGNTDPNNYFFSDLSGEIVHLNSAGELEQAKTIASSKYDYIYLEHNVRKSYKENGLIHGNNDFDKKQTYNGGKLILGKVSANTSVNDFVANINFGGAVISLLNAKGEIVYGKDADSKFTDKLNNASEYAVGTGWKLKVYTTAGDLIDEISISVLGDLTGDGKVNSADINYLRQVANNGIESLSAEQRLSSLIVNKGNLPA